MCVYLISSCVITTNLKSLMEVRFYHLEKTPLEKGCAKLLERVLSSGERAVVFCQDMERLDHLNKVLWTYSSAAFLPHGSEKEGFASRQPIWLTTSWENPNDAQVVVVSGGEILKDNLPFKRCLDIFDASHDSALVQARDRWRLYRERGYSLAYWKQNAQGAWETPAPSQAQVDVE